ncbi:MAG: hypothetical protein EHM65_10160, partial [Acidobacteriales bacterium]
MNETIRIRIQIDGVSRPLEDLSQDGVILSGESSALPRGLAISLQPGNPITEFRLRRVRTIQDWEPGVFRFSVALENGALVCRGIDSLSLPFGGYRLRVMISDLKPLRQPLDIDVPDNGTAEVVTEFRTDPRVV